MSRSAPPATSLNPRLPKKSATPSFITAFALPRAHTAERTVRPFGEQRQHHEGHDREPDRRSHADVVDPLDERMVMPALHSHPVNPPIAPSMVNVRMPAKRAPGPSA